MNAKIESIGRISHGVEGSDEYVRIKTDGTPSAEDVRVWLLRQFHRNTTQEAGGYFCHRVTIMARPYFDDEFVGIIHHQYDV